MSLDAYANVTDLAWALHYTAVPASGTGLTHLQAHLTRAKRKMDATFKTSWSTSSPPGEVAEVCIDVAVRAWQWGEQMRLAQGASSSSDLGVSYNFPRGSQYYITKENRTMIVGNAATKTYPMYVAGGYNKTQSDD